MIFLTGFMGCGKSYTAEATVKKMPSLRFADTDKIIESKSNTSIPEIFSAHGEKYFRELEYSVLEEMIAVKKYDLVSLGGGTFIYRKSRELIKKSEQSIFIDTPFEICLNRIQRDVNRPNAVKRTKKELLNLFKQRKKYYKQADYTVRYGQNAIELLLELLN